MNGFHRNDSFLARIAYEIYIFRYYFVAFAGGKKSTPEKLSTFDDFLIKFTREKDEPKRESKVTEAEVEVEQDIEDLKATALRNKAYWMAFAGLDKEGKPLKAKAGQVTKKPRK